MVSGQLVFRGELRSHDPQYDAAWPPADEASARAAERVEEHGLREILDDEVTVAPPSCELEPDHDACTS